MDGSTPIYESARDQRELRLLGYFHLAGASAPAASALGTAGQRLMALLAVHAGVVARWQAAQVLYPHGDGVHAAANLRAALWRLQRCCPDVLIATATELRLATGLAVDYWTALSTARKLLAQRGGCDAAELAQAMGANLRDDLLPGWPEPWLVPERERFHQLRLHALEALCVRLTSCGWYGAAVDVGLAAVGADPFRESARGALIGAYLAEGNAREALRQFEAFRALLHAELGLQPSGELRRQVSYAVGSRSPGLHQGAQDHVYDAGGRHNDF